jgi:hypothetical protein
MGPKTGLDLVFEIDGSKRYYFYQECKNVVREEY